MKHYSYLIFLFFLNGCFYKRVPVPDTISLVNYPTQLKDANDQNKKEYAAAWEDFILAREGANKQVISSQADSLIKISRIWADFFPANTSNQPV